MHIFSQCASNQYRAGQHPLHKFRRQSPTANGCFRFHYLYCAEILWIKITCYFDELFLTQLCLCCNSILMSLEKFRQIAAGQFYMGFFALPAASLETPASFSRNLCSRFWHLHFTLKFPLHFELRLWLQPSSLRLQIQSTGFLKSSLIEAIFLVGFWLRLRSATIEAECTKTQLSSLLCCSACARPRRLDRCCRLQIARAPIFLKSQMELEKANNNAYQS